MTEDTNDQREDPSTHTAALQGAAAGGALGGSGGYAGGLLTGSENHIGLADIPDAEDPESDDWTLGPGEDDGPGDEAA